MYMSDVFTAENLEVLLERQITHIVSIIGSGLRPKYPDRFTYHAVSINDDPSENIKTHLLGCVEFIENALL